MEEHQEQCALICWWAYQCQALGVPENLLFAIPNGGDRNVLVGKKLKLEGVRRGVPDLFLAYPVGNFHGLFIEMKRCKGGRTSPEQRAMLDMLSDHGFSVAICAGFKEAKAVIEGYLGIGNGGCGNNGNNANNGKRRIKNDAQKI